MAGKKLIVLVMSVGPYEKNGTAKWLEQLGGTEHMYVVLPKQFKNNEKSYHDRGIKTYIYNEQQYINNDFEFFGFKPRNCGGVGRQGIAEAVDVFAAPDTLFLQLDDDTGSINLRKRKLIDGKIVWKSHSIRKFATLELLMNAFDDFYNETGIKVQGATGATPLGDDKFFFANRKIFNNFLMYPDDEFKGKGFRYLCSDDVLYNYTKNIIGGVPMASVAFSTITFNQNQGDREDGNAPLYNKDCSWKKSYCLRMFNPLLSIQYIAKEKNRILFRETLQYSKLYPPIMLADEEGNITHKLLIT